jgi:hypothetical protein
MGMTMKIERVIPQPQPEFTMTFSRDDGWAIVAALSYYAEKHVGAVERDEWKQWAADLDKELRR